MSGHREQGSQMNGEEKPEDARDPVLAMAEIRRLSPAAVAYIGDAVYELYVRQRNLFPPQRIQTYHRAVVDRVCAQAQAATLQQLSEHLTEAELVIVRWGANGCGRIPRHLDVETYRQASGFETLIGYLHLTNPPRLQTLLALIQS